MIERSPAHSRAAAILGAAFLVLYVATANRGLQFGDSGEFQSVALLGGIPHASGYPLWILLARAFTWLPLGSPEFRVTVFSALCGALTLALMVRRMGEMRIGLAASLTAAAFLGCTFSFWRVAGRAEVYALTGLLMAFAFGAVLRGRSLPAGLLLGVTLLVHPEYAALVAVAGLALAWREWRAAPGDLVRQLLLLGAFLLGLAPYLLLAALDAAGVRVNHLDLIRERAALLGPPAPALATPWQGVGWLLTSRDAFPPAAHPLQFHPRSVLAMAAQAVPLFVLFELGPVALLAAVAGCVRRARRDAGLAIGLVLAILGTVVLTAWLQFGAMLQLFLLPAMLAVTPLVADGLDATFDRLAGRARGGAPGAVATPSAPRPRVRFVAAIAAWLLLVVPPHALRIVADARPIGPAGWRVSEEDLELHAGLLPGVPPDRGAGAWAHAAMAAFPQDARVFAIWSYFTPLRHLQMVEGLRADVTLRQLTQDTIEPRLRRWQAERDPAESPIVLIAERSRLAPLLAGADSLSLPGGRVAWVLRRPVDDAALRAAAATR